MKTFEEVRRRFLGGQEEALLRKLWLAAGGEKTGEEGLRAVLRNEQAITLVDAVLKLVDGNGQFIPLKGMTSGNDFVDLNKRFRLVQPEKISTAAILARLQRFFAGMTFVSVDEFNRRTLELLKMLKTVKQMKGLAKGVHFQICLPQMDVGDNYGEVLDRVFLDAVKRSYEAQFSGRTFINYRAGTLHGQVGVVDESRHGQLIKKMKRGPVVGIYFPNPMQGFSIPADRKLIHACPEGFLLTGAIDTAVAMVAKPDVLARDVNTPILDCAANSWQSSESSLYFGVKDGKFRFNNGILDAHGSYSGGVLFVG